MGALAPVKGSVTPWGPAQGVEEMAPGVVFVSTSGHGGVWLSPEMLAKVPAALLVPSTFYTKGSQWFEEDCEILRVACAFPALFKTPHKSNLETLCRIHEGVRLALSAAAAR